jgi:hypothetical protein
VGAKVFTSKLREALAVAAGQLAPAATRASGSCADARR